MLPLISRSINKKRERPEEDEAEEQYSASTNPYGGIVYRSGILTAALSIDLVIWIILCIGNSDFANGGGY
ncbi:unnamed protein product [Cuscuta campestris]|uniref:Uncharacterized protein n=1 Tax=Cuscuta campestris TaxID=132261 RepID=A0A484N331_9ASTE|nr:unnamed protein product [Cuscuta campestris]